MWEGKAKTRQKMVDLPDYGLLDTVKVSFDSFMHSLNKGVPQAWEALYSNKADTRNLPTIVADTAHCVHVYSRTIYNFAVAGDLKRQRHALRMSLNLNDLIEWGMFDPTLSEDELDIVMIQDTMEEGELLEYIRELSPYFQTKG